MKFHSFSEVNDWLAQFVPHTAESAYTLERITKLMQLLGNPQDHLKIVHVAGTSGKTSTSYYIAKMLQLSGQKVGLSVSPHIDEVNERLQLDNAPIAEARYCNLLSEFSGVEGLLELRPTYFELLVAFAFWVFARENVDYAVMEVGMGGLFDGTNVAKNKDKICIITDIGLDHMAILGDTIPEIAKQKAGIIHPKNEVFMAEQADDVMRTVSDYAREQSASLHVPSNESVAPRSLPPYQRRNLSLAKFAYDFIAQRDSLPPLSAQQVIETASIVIPGRMELRYVRGKTLILDGAHNAAKFAALASSLDLVLEGQKAVFLLGMLESKEMHLKESIELIKSYATSVIATTVQPQSDLPHTSLSAKALAEACEQAGVKAKIIPNVQEALDYLLASDSQKLVATGSLYLLAELRKLL